MGIMATYLEEYDAPGTPYPTPWRALTTLMSLAGCAIVRGPLIKRVVARTTLRAKVNGQMLPPTPYLAIAAGTTPQIGLGFAPFPRCEPDAGRF